MQRLVCALNNFCCAIISTDAFDELIVRFARTFCDKDIAGPPQVSWRFAQGSSRQQKFIAERGLPIDQHDIESMFKVEVLEAIIEQEGVNIHPFNCK